MAKRSESRQLIERIAALEQFVSAIKEAQAAAVYHQNEAVDLSVINAESALSEAVKSLAQYERTQTAKLLDVAWFYAKFAQDILAAEATENILGQGIYLDLVETPKQVRDWFEHTVERLENRLLSYEGELLDGSGQEDREIVETREIKDPSAQEETK